MVRRGAAEIRRRAEITVVAGPATGRPATTISMSVGKAIRREARKEEPSYVLRRGGGDEGAEEKESERSGRADGRNGGELGELGDMGENGV